MFRGKIIRTVFSLALLCASGAWVSGQENANATPSRPNKYARRDLVVNRPEYARPETRLIDPLLVNPWGSAIRPAGAGGHFWLANAGSATVTTYVGDTRDANGAFTPLFQDSLRVVPTEGSPIGQVFNSSTSEFLVTDAICSDDGAPVCDPSQPSYLGEITSHSRFIVNTEEGQIAAWMEGTRNGVFGRMRRFKTIVDRADNQALYRGLAITDFPSGNRLYAANFRRDRIEMYDGQWNRIRRVRLFGNIFVRPFVKPFNIPSDYVVFNVQYLRGHVFVTYAQLIQPGDPDYDPADPFAERACDGCGYVAVFTKDGLPLGTLQSRGRLNAPWGMAVAPSDFGRFSNALLVGNFGDGTIVGFDLRTGRQIDYLRDDAGERIEIAGLWAIFFGNGSSLGRADYLYWTAGFNDEEDGGFGSLNWINAINPNP
jgi:uncharacterized protein (TIGR03118 family)